MTLEKKKILILRGNGHFDKLSGIQLEKELIKQGYDVHFHKYSHWPQEGTPGWDQKPEDINFELELDNLKQYFEQNGAPDYVLAKSAGSVVTSLAIQKGLINPKKVILMGLPMKWKHPFVHGKLEEIIRNTPLPIGTRFIQESEDPFGGYEMIKEIFGNHILDQDYVLHEIEGNNHQYNYSDELMNIINDYFSN